MSDIIGSFLGIFNTGAQRQMADINNRVSAANAAASNKVRTARNGLEAANNSLARWVQSVNNNRALKAGGEALAANSTNFRRGSDAGVREDFSRSIQSAEQAGMARAQQAASGVDGSVVDAVNQSMRLRDSIVTQQIQDYRGFQAYDTAYRAGHIMSQTIGGLDQSLILDTFDNNIDVAKQYAKPSYFMPLLNFAKDAVQVAATFGASESQGPTGGSGGTTPADQRPSSRVKFGFNAPSTEDASPYSLGSGANLKLGNNTTAGGWWSPN